MKRRDYRELTERELAALVEFAKAHGRCWRHELNDVYWYNARVWRGGSDENIGHILHSIRNNFGPTWLYDVFKLPKDSK